MFMVIEGYNILNSSELQMMFRSRRAER